MSSFADHFSAAAESYAVYRPHYPAKLFEWLASVAPANDLAWYQEARRTLVRGGVLAVWSYGLGKFGEPAIDEALARFYGTTVGSYWPPERVVVDEGYEKLDFPFDGLAPPLLTMEARWTLAQLAGYLGTWSAVRRARSATGVDPLPGFLDHLAPLWGEPPRPRIIRWPVSIRAGRVA